MHDLAYEIVNLLIGQIICYSILLNSSYAQVHWVLKIFDCDKYLIFTIHLIKCYHLFKLFVF